MHAEKRSANLRIVQEEQNQVKEWKTERYDTLPEEAVRIRAEVFVQEQGFKQEFDGTDDRAVHLVMYVGGEPAAVCRYYWSSEKSAHVIGRVEVRKPFRGSGLGAGLLREAETQILADGGTQAWLSAQLRAEEFYEKQGYRAEGEVFLDEYCPHVWMKKILR